MNTVGKVLVILNFLFAVVVGAFLIVDFAARTDWKTQAEKQAKNNILITADRDAHAADAAELRSKNKELQQNIADNVRKLSDQESESKVAIQKVDLVAEEYKNKAKEADATLAKAQSDVERLKTSEKDLKKIVEQREQSILALTDDVKKYRNDAIFQEQQAKQLADRNQELLAQLVTLQQKAMQVAAAAPGGASQEQPLVPKNGGESNPPSTFVKGKVERVDPQDGTLVQISLGTDQGVNKNNTLEIFRTFPEPKYLGMVRIVEANFNRSVGRLIVPTGAPRPQLKEGDNVWSRLK
jgi:hypothetical protein